MRGDSTLDRALGRRGWAAGAVLAAALGLLGPAGVGALECAAPPGADPRLASIPAEQRAAFLRARLDAARPGAQAWSWTWGAVNGGLTAGQLVAIPFTSNDAARWVLLAGAATSALGVAQVVLLPITPASVPDEGGGCAELARLEQSLERSARNVELGSGAMAQLGNVVINAALAVGAGFADGRWTTGVLSFGIGWAIGETQILTMPTALPLTLERYRAAELTGAGAATGSPRLALTGSVGDRGGVIAIRATF